MLNLIKDVLTAAAFTTCLTLVLGFMAFGVYVFVEYVEFAKLTVGLKL